METFKFKEVWVLDGNDQISNWVEQEGRLDHDQNLLPEILRLIKPGDTVIDAGAYCGDHTIAYLRAVGEGGFVHAFEPNPVAFECLVHNVGDSPREAARQVALGDTSSMVPLSGNNGIPSGGYIGEHQEVSRVAMRPLDLFELKPDLIKIDVEGCELKMLMGAVKTITQSQPKMVLEINKGALERQGATPDQIFDWLKVHGYNWSIIESNAIVHDPLYNILALPISRSGRSDGNKSGGIEQSSSPASGTILSVTTGTSETVNDQRGVHAACFPAISKNKTAGVQVPDAQEAHRGKHVPASSKDAGVTCCPTASPPVTPFNLFAMSLSIQQLKDFAAIDSNHRMRVMMNLSKAGLTPRWRNKKKKK